MKAIRSLIGVLLTVVLLAGCGGAKPKEAEPAAPKAETPKVEEKKSWAPDKPVTLIVPYSAGGATDMLARTVEKVWSKHVPQPLTIVNKSGASAMEGRLAVIQSKPDGQTLLIDYGSSADMLVPHLRQLTHDPLTDLVPVSMITTHSVLIAVPANSPYKTLPEMIEAGKKGTPLTASVSGAGNLMDIAIRAIAGAAGVEITTVPFKGGGPATTALVGGQVSLSAGHPSEFLPHVKADRLRILAVALPERDPSLPDVPTLKELGINFTNVGSLKGIAAPKGTPAEVLAYYEGVFKKITEDPEFKAGMAAIAQPVVYKNQAEFTALTKQTYADFGKLVKDLKIELK
ncbi:MAG: tripartite tricarboxylate transporter substrate binding protein [Bacillota bacterium]